MKKFLIVLLLLIPSHVFAGDGVYVKGNVGIFMPNDSDIEFRDIDIGGIDGKPGFGIGAAIGTGFSNGFDIEAEYTYREAKVGGHELDGNLIVNEIDSKVKTKTLMFNSIYNFNKSSSLTPYLGGGIGVGWVDIGDFSDTAFAYQFLGGIEAPLSKNSSILLGYRYLGMSELENDEEFTTNMDSHNLEIGFKYSF